MSEVVLQVSCSRCRVMLLHGEQAKQLYPDDDIEVVQIERTSFSMKEHDWKSLEPYLRMVWILD